MANDNIELVDSPFYVRIGLSRKIKSKKISFKNISSRWNEFRLNRLRNKLVEERENLTEMEFSSEQLSSNKGRERTEMKIFKKTKALAKLESKITFLETGNYLGEDYINSRAIKLKTLMMKNLEWNRNNLYGINDVASQKIISGEQLHDIKLPEDKIVKQPLETSVEKQADNQEIDRVIDEETTKISEKVREILAKKNVEEIKETHQAELPKQENVAIEKAVESPTTVIRREEIENSIDGEMNRIDVTPTITSDKVAEAIENEMNKIKVSNNGSSVAKVNKFINEDGTYRMKKEDIDEDFRITRFDRTKLPTEAETSIGVKPEPNIPPFNMTPERKKTDVEAPRKALTAIVNREIHKFPEFTPPSIKEQPEETHNDMSKSERELPIVVPERKQKVKVTVKQGKKANLENVETTESSVYIPGDLGSLMARVSVLKAEKKTIDSKAEDAERKAQNAEQSYLETMRELSAYADNLEKDCNTSYQTMRNAEKKAAATEAQINAMLSMMEAATSETEETKGRIK